MKLLLLACLSPHTGNCTTAQRIRGHVESAGHTCILRDVTDFQSPGDVAVLLSRETPFDGLLAIHLYKGGRLLLGSQVPYGIIFGGTDINEDVKDATKRAVMEQVLEGARFAVAFSTKMKEDAERLWPSSASKVHVQPQGIMTNAAPGFCWSDFLRSAGVRDAGEDLRVFLLVCGLRRVKDPLYLVEAFSEWHCEEPSVVLVIIGPKPPIVRGAGLLQARYTPPFDGSHLFCSSGREAPKGCRGLLGPREESGGAPRSAPALLRLGQQLHLRGDVRRHPGGHGPGRARGGQGCARQCCHRSPRGNRTFVLEPSGVCVPLQEAAGRRRSAGAPGGEREVLHPAVPQHLQGEGGLPAVCGAPALSIASSCRRPPPPHLSPVSPSPATPLTASLSLPGVLVPVVDGKQPFLPSATVSVMRKLQTPRGQKLDGLFLNEGQAVEPFSGELLTVAGDAFTLNTTLLVRTSRRTRV